MFRNQQNESKPRPAEDSSSKAINLVGSATTIKGEVTTESDIRIDGRINGNIYTHTKLVLGESGVINGDLYCESADVSGQITGNIYCKELLKLQATSRIEGDITTKRMVVEKGALFNGKCIMKEQIEFPDQQSKAAKPQNEQTSGKKEHLEKNQQTSSKS